MNTDLEMRLRSELREAARQVQPEMLRGLAEPGAARSPRPAKPRWLAPAMAVLAVLAVLTGVRLAIPGPGVRPSPGGVSAGGVSPAGTPGGMPPFYVTDTAGYFQISADSNRVLSNGPGVSVRASATGAVLGRVTVPPNQAVTSITAAANDRVFVLASSRRSGAVSDTTLWRLTLAPDGHPAQFERMRTFIPSGGLENQTVDSIALSADGTLLAVSVNADSGSPGGKGPGLARIELISMRADRQLRAWTVPGALTSTLSWALGDRTLVFNCQMWVGDKRDARLLDVTKPGGSAAAHSTPLPIQAPTRAAWPVVAIDGGSEYLAWTQATSTGGLAGTQGDWVLGVYAADTGQRLRSLIRVDDGNDGRVLGADPTGQFLLIGAAGKLARPDLPSPPSSGPVQPVPAQLGRLDNGRLTLLPPWGSLDPLAAAW